MKFCYFDLLLQNCDVTAFCETESAVLYRYAIYYGKREQQCLLDGRVQPNATRMSSVGCRWDCPLRNTTRTATKVSSCVLICPNLDVWIQHTSCRFHCANKLHITTRHATVETAVGL